MRRIEGFLTFGDEYWEGNLVYAHHKLAMICKKIMDGEVVSPERRLHHDWEFHFALVRACNSRHMIACFFRMYMKSILDTNCCCAIIAEKKPFFFPGRQLEPFSIVFSTARPMLRPKDTGE
jgi:hypothetical protein